VIGLPHTGTAIAADLLPQFVSPWLARRDADWWIDRLYGFAAAMGATVVHTAISRSVIDANRDPSGVSLYPGQVTTGLCPTETFDGAPLYGAGFDPDAAEIERRRVRWHAPYHAALASELVRLRRIHPRIVLYDAHAIRSHVPRLFDGELPQFNIGTNSGASCAPGLTAAVAAASGASQVINGRFKGGYTTRHHGNPGAGIHALQMELAMRGYLDEPATPDADNWPPAYDTARAEPMLATLKTILTVCLHWAAKEPS
ncbi:MAG: N-formylglutamate deformylase, partial [Polymorphobacter sp.]